MAFSISNEVYILLFSFLAGALIAFIYDLFRIMRKKVCAGVFFSDIHDILFWILATAVMFGIIFYANNGTLRWYQFLGALFGGSFYFLTLSRLAVTALSRLIDIFFKIFNFFLKILLTPLKFTYNIVCVFLSFIISPIVRFFKSLSRKTLYHACKGLKTVRLALTKK